MFSHEICNICIFNRTPPDDVSFENIGFFRTFFYRAPPGNYLLHVQVAEFQPAYTVKSYFRGTFQAFYTRTRSNYLKAFLYLKSMKIIFEEDNLQWSCKIPNCKFTKKTLSHILLHVSCLHFLRTHQNDIYWKRLWKCASSFSFRKYNILLSPHSLWFHKNLIVLDRGCILFFCILTFALNSLFQQ